MSSKDSKYKFIDLFAGIGGTRLGYELARILKEKRPAAFMLENVKNLISHDKGNTFKVITEILEGLGYFVNYKVIDARVLVPQHRERIYIVGFDKRIVPENFVFKFPEIIDQKPKLKDILEQSVDPKYTLSDKLWNYLQAYAKKHKEKGNGFGYGIGDPEGVTRTLSARYHKDGAEILIAQEGKNPRRLIPRECARLMGFPDTQKIPVSDTQAYHQFGNSIVVPVVERVAKEVIKTLDCYYHGQTGQNPKKLEYVKNKKQEYATGGKSKEISFFQGVPV